MTVIGLGEAGCSIAELFEGNDKFNVKLFDTNIEGDNCFSLQKQASPESYEKHFPDVQKFLEDSDEEILFFVAGGGNISGATLKLLNYVKDRKIYVVYIKPDIQSLDNMQKMQDRLVYNVLQEYTRSGMFTGMIVVSNEQLENVCGEVPAYTYYLTLNKLLVNTILAIKNGMQKEPIYDTYSSPREVACIATYGVYDLKTDEEKFFYDLSNIENKCYYFFINKNRLENDGHLFKEIKNTMKKKSVDSVKISCIIHETDSEEDFCYVTANSSKIQR